MINRISAFDIIIDAVSREQALQTVVEWLKAGEGKCRYVITPNVNHIVNIQKNNDFKEAYLSASLVITDGKPVYFALKILRKSVPTTIPGSEFVPDLFSYTSELDGVKVFLLGAAPGVAERAKIEIEKAWHHVRVVGHYSPPFGFEFDNTQNSLILHRIETCDPDILIIGLGAPKQELWVYNHLDKIKAKVAFCTGATIDFLALEKKRAPRWMRKLSLEWLFRIYCEPHRLTKRYVHDGILFPIIFWKELVNRNKS